MSEFYDASAFWDDVLRTRFDLTGTGHGGYGPRYNHYLYRAKERAFGRVLRAADLELRSRSVLDVGCGSGFFTRIALAAGCRTYTGADITPTAVERLRERHPGQSFVVADIGAETLPPALGGTFDVVLCIDVLYHVVDPVRFERAVANLWARVAPGGHLVLVDAFGSREYVPGGSFERHGGQVPHCRFRGRAQYERLLFARPDADVVAEQPMYFLFNRPIEGTTWPWTSSRLSWHLRRRALEARPVLLAMEAVDRAVTRVRRGGADLKFCVVRKRTGGDA